MSNWHGVLAGTLLISMGAFGLAACGGGGGGGGTDARPLMPLSADGAADTVQTALLALEGGDLLGGDLGVGIMSVDPVAGQGVGSSPGEPVRHVTTQILDRLRGTVSMAPRSPEDELRAGIQSVTEFCDSGSMTYDETATSGYVRFNDCVFDLSSDAYMRLNGQMDISNVQSSSNATCSYRESMDLRYRMLSVQFYESGLLDAHFAMDGALAVLYEECTGFDSIRVSGSRVQMTLDDMVLAYYKFDFRHREYPLVRWEDHYSVTLDTTDLPGSVDIATSMDLHRQWSDDYPSEGRIRVAGANGSELLIVVNNSAGPQAVHIQADFNGDGVVDCDVELSWQQVEEGGWACNPS